MTTTTWGWLILLFPLLGTITISLGWRTWRGTAAGWIASLAIALAFAASVGALLSLLGHPATHRQLTSSLWHYDFTVGVDANLSILVDPLSVLMALLV
ncbi:MAG: NADH-quinone oxidoreductase subunit L, partial [Solirubrobacteraceae bacterium]